MKRILIIEDDPGDVYLITEMLNECVTAARVESEARLSGGLARIGKEAWDVVLLDLGLPDSQGLETIRKLCAGSLDVPIIVLTGLADENTGISALHEGAQDYLVKGQINGRMLAKTIRYAIERKKIENDKQKLIQELQEALAKVKLLGGLLPICASCKKIRDDKGYWNQIEAYVSEHSEAEFSHGICPDCAQKLYPDYYHKIYPKSA